MMSPPISAELIELLRCSFRRAAAVVPLVAELHSINADQSELHQARVQHNVVRIAARDQLASGMKCASNPRLPDCKTI